MEKVSSVGGSLQALLDATNLRPQLHYRPTSLPSVGSLLLPHQQPQQTSQQPPPPSQRGCGEVPEASSSTGWENSENAAPPSATVCRKRPLDDSVDEPDGPLVAMAVRPQPAVPPMKKRQRQSDQGPALMRRQVQQQQQKQQQSFAVTASASESASASALSPINLVKRECSITLRCIAEFRQRPQQLQLPQQLHQHERSGYVSVPSDLPVSGLTRFVLNDLGIGGFSPGDCLTKLAMPCWKQLTLSDICADADATSVGSLLQLVCGAALLRIELPLPDSTLVPSHIIRPLLRSLLPPQVAPAGQAHWLRQVGCPIAEATLEAYLQLPDSFEFPAADRALFGDWHNRMCLQYLEQMAKAPPGLLSLPLPILPLPIGRQSQSYQPAAGVEVVMETPQPLPLTPLALTAATSPSSASSAGQRSGRLRTCFDTESELPLLQQWFGQNPHPSREQLARYRDALNALPIRRNGSRRPLDSANVAYWFKNMRATERRLSSSAAGPSSKEAAIGEFDSESSSPQPQAPLRLCVEEDDAAEQPVPEAQPPGVDESIDSGSGAVGGASKRRRTRVFIDPATEIPQLEIWFGQDSHPSSAQFQLYAQVLNGMPFRQRQPRLEAKNVQLWFKNHRAKVKRERLPEPTSGDAAAGAATAADDDLDVETTDAEVEVDTIDAGADETAEAEVASPPAAALELVCKTECID